MLGKERANLRAKRLSLGGKSWVHLSIR